MEIIRKFLTSGHSFLPMCSAVNNNLLYLVCYFIVEVAPNMIHVNGHPSFPQNCWGHRTFHSAHCNNSHSTVKFTTSNGVYSAAQKIPRE